MDDAEPQAPRSTSSQPGGIAITREFKAPPGAVFDAWTTPHQFSVWFGGSDSAVPVETVSMDLRENGAWRATMFAAPDRRKISWSGTYREVDRPRRLVFTMSDAGEDPDSHGGGEFAKSVDADENITVELCDNNGRTEMFFHQTGENLSGEQYAQAEAGWQTFFDDLAELVE